jgi:hypothetical protein
MENRSAQWVYERRPVGTIRRVRDSARFREAPPAHAARKLHAAVLGLVRGEVTGR